MSWAVHKRRKALGEPGGVIGMRVRKKDRCRPDTAEPPQPVCSAVNHDAGAGLLNEQCAVIPMPPGAKLDASARAKKGQLHCHIGRLHTE